MALTDVHFSEGEGQDFLVEVPVGSYSGSFSDIGTEGEDSEQFIVEIPAAEGGGGNIFIMSE